MCQEYCPPAKATRKIKRLTIFSPILATQRRRAPGKEKERYIAQLQAVIQSHLKDAEAYSGKRCTLRITLAPDGMPSVFELKEAIRIFAAPP